MTWATDWLSTFLILHWISGKIKRELHGDTPEANGRRTQSERTVNAERTIDEQTFDRIKNKE